MLALEAGGAGSRFCTTITIAAPQTTPTSHDTMMAFVSLHHIRASTNQRLAIASRAATALMSWPSCSARGPAGGH
jgi:hypothetical protein